MNANNQETNKQESNIKEFTSHYGKLFLWVLTLFSIVFIIFLYCANRRFRKSQEDIKQSYIEHIQKADSLYWDMVAYNKKYTSYIGDANTAILTDSLIRLSLGTNQRLSAEQYRHLYEIISCHFEGITLLHEKYDSKIQRDSLLLITERQVLEGQVKTMLDLHLNKIEHEYSNITLWAAVLTILFLVFSFYSIFKMDDLVNQGNEGVREIRQLKRDGGVTIQEISDKGEKILKENDALIEDTKSKLSNFMNSQQQIVSETLSAIHTEIRKIKQESERFSREVAEVSEQVEKMHNDSVRALKENLSQIQKQYDDALRSKVEELNSYIDNFHSLIPEGKQGISKNHQMNEDRKESEK